SFIVQTPHHNILVDSCVGNHKPRPMRPAWDKMQSDGWEKGLAATGLGVGDIDFVMCTHLHIDHVGWNTRLENGRWVPTFPNATYIMAERALLHWEDRYQKKPDTCPWIGDSVIPVIDARRAQLVRSDHVLED